MAEMLELDHMTDSNIRIAELEKMRQDLIAQLGESLYHVTKDDSNLRMGREALYDGIAQIDSECEALQSQIQVEASDDDVAAIASDVPFADIAAAAIDTTDIAAVAVPDAVLLSELADVSDAVDTADDSADSALVCPICGGALVEGDVFCGYCGTRLETPSTEPKAEEPQAPVAMESCAICGMPLQEGQLFCGNCGAKNEPAHLQSAAEDVASVQTNAPISASDTVQASPDSTARFALDSALTCSRCGAMLRQGDVFCLACGTKVGE